jgi:SAM-dependent methyltransferase
MENLERGSDLVRDGRPFLLADIEHLPFRDAVFDYLYAVHVLEHAANPPAALAELTRVARGGYIETPTRFAERIYGWKNHRCTVRFRNGGFTFGSKVTPQTGLDLHRLYRSFVPWKAVHKLVDFSLNVLYVRVEFRRTSDGTEFRPLGRRQAIADLIRHRLHEGVGPLPHELQS